MCIQVWFGSSYDTVVLRVSVIMEEMVDGRGSVFVMCQAFGNVSKHWIEIFAHECTGFLFVLLLEMFHDEVG